MSDKYREFRNFMANELGITRDDIEAWTKEAVALQVGKLVGQINLSRIAEHEVEKQVRAALEVHPYGKDSIVVSRALAKFLADKITVAIKPTTP